MGLVISLTVLSTDLHCNLTCSPAKRVNHRIFAYTTDERIYRKVARFSNIRAHVKPVLADASDTKSSVCTTWHQLSLNFLFSYKCLRIYGNYDCRLYMLSTHETYVSLPLENVPHRSEFNYGLSSRRAWPVDYSVSPMF